MLQSLHLTNFTVFPDADLKFGKNLNIFVGENGAGKTHILKAAYSILSVMAGGSRESSSNKPTKAYLQTALASKMRGVFRPDRVGRLVRRETGRQGRNRSDIQCRFSDGNTALSFSLNTAT